jgi:hypothetical protein
MNVPWDAIALTVRQTAPGLLICASVLIASLLVLQAWSTMVGVGVGAIAAVLAGAHWKSDSLPTAQMWRARELAVCSAIKTRGCVETENR